MWECWARRSRAEAGGPAARSVTRKNPASWMAGGAARELAARRSQHGPQEGRSRVAASGGSSKRPWTASQGRRHSPTISSTLRECTLQSPRSKNTTQQDSPSVCMAAPARVSGSGSVPPHGHVHARPRPRPAYSVSEIPANSATATVGDPRASATGG